MNLEEIVTALKRLGVGTKKLDSSFSVIVTKDGDYEMDNPQVTMIEDGLGKLFLVYGNARIRNREEEG